MSPLSARLQAAQPWIQYGIFLQALVATLGSLYFSTYGDIAANLMSGNLFDTSLGLLPCMLCWFARILMYPIVPISVVGMIKNDRRFTDYILPLAIPGVLLEIYHYSLQMLPIKSSFGCTSSNPCDALQVAYFGFITIPFLCLVAFCVILTLALLNTWANKSQK